VKWIDTTFWKAILLNNLMFTNLITSPKISSTESEYPNSLQSARKLFEAFALNNIRYCHWKSNLRLENGLLGKTDLDLLVDPAQADLLRRIFAEHNIKLVLAPAGKRYPGIEDYLGFDSESGKLFHLHVHYLLVLGEQFVKNYHIPLEQQFLNSTISVGGWINIPTPELELSILCLRALLKYRDRDALKDVLSIRSSGLPSHILNELAWLGRQTTMDRMAQVLSELSDILPASAILEFLETISSNPRNGWKLLQLRGQVRKALSRYQRHNRVEASLHYFRELWRRQALPRFRPARGMTLPGGGVTITLIGADGSGKTTLCALLGNWLGWRLDVHSYYLGSKKPSRLSAGLYTAFRMARRAQHELGKWIGNGSWLMHQLAAVREFFLYSHYLSIGNDRYSRYAKATREARSGSISIFDRFPYESPLDGPEIKENSGEDHKNLVGFFSQREKKIYNKISYPDLIILLKVTPEVSHKRKPDHDLEMIREKDKVIGKLESSLRANTANNWASQDADIPIEDVLLQLKRKIWAAL
jgi:thymidylate kinase